MVSKALIHHMYLAGVGGLLTALVNATIHYILIFSGLESKFLTQNKQFELTFLFAGLSFIASTATVLFWLWGNDLVSFKK